MANRRANPGTVEQEAIARCRPEDAFAVASSYDVRLSWDLDEEVDVAAILLLPPSDRAEDRH